MSIWLASYKVRKPSVNYVKELIRQRKYMSEIQTDSQSKIKDKRLEMRIQENDYPDLSFDEDDSSILRLHLCSLLKVKDDHLLISFTLMMMLLCAICLRSSVIDKKRKECPVVKNSQEKRDDQSQIWTTDKADEHTRMML